ncbi:radical SAM protein [Faecalicatena fissicatena]|uniref:Radical SAM protein n=1 Tax=Faecalicatena fissicatena TaxID=290055 RepID=A0ABS2E6S7_9FIRM|nr:radical SAM protein [Faecalicatena fissicatena]MBM6737331.1 radical SAM protein [Faecalicatena fissicatena]HIX98704.1 radical SAM protein [Candidatus Dorea intestinigallinarum]
MHSPLPPSDTAPNFDPCDLYRDCTLCPRMCHANRYVRTGICGCGPEIRAARAALHFWEEPCISGQDGSGAVFFSGCTLKCCYCQNYPISRGEVGKAISQERLEEIFLELQDQGARNIDLITATQFLPSILPVLEKVRPKLHIPIVYNCGGYERVETLRMLEGYVDVYLPDLKYFSSDKAKKYSGAPDYFQHASAAVEEMIRQTEKPVFDENGILVRGTLIRHMVLPGQKEDSIRLLGWMAENLPKGGFLLSLLSQYTPFFKAAEHPQINRRLTSYEYGKVLDAALELGLDTGYMQERSSAREEYTPPFDLEGL